MLFSVKLYCDHDQSWVMLFSVKLYCDHDQSDGTNARELQERGKGGSLGRFKLFLTIILFLFFNNHRLTLF